YVDVDLEPAQLAERLTVLGMEVKGLERWGADWQNVVVGELLEVGKHPRADRLSLTKVVVGAGSEPIEIVCGATNIAAGQRVPVALPGAVLPGGRRIERAEKMGVVSNGMLASGDELGLTSDADGILILPPDTPIGEALTDLYGDWVLDVDVKPNRGDCLSLVGLAREVAAATGADVRFPDVSVEEGSDDVAAHLSVDVRDATLCPRFVGRWVSGLRVGPSPDRVQMRLLAAGMRPVSNVVDASNYVMLELGKPIHTFDAGAVGRDRSGRARLVVRLAAPGERLETLDHVERELTPDTLVIADEDRPLAIAGVMGGANSEVSERTTDVVIESAIFDPVSIRRTAFRYALRSEASLRFEKGQELRLARLGADRTARLIREWAGGTVARGRVDTAPEEPGPLRVTFRPERVNRLLGTGFSVDEQRALLERVGVATEESSAASLVTVATAPELILVEPDPGEAIDALVPSWRRDIVIEADVAEEVARLHGYESIPPVTPDTAMPHYRPNPLEVRDLVRETLDGAGLHEVATYALVSPSELDEFPLVPDVAVPDGEEAATGRPIRVTNPLSSQHSVLRQRLLPSLLRVVDTNARQGRADVAIFEVGKGYGAEDDLDAPEPVTRTREWWRLGLAVTGSARPRHWADEPRAWDLDDAKGLLALLCAELGFGAPVFAPLRDDPTLPPGRAATVVARGHADATPALAGRVGEIHPAVAERLELRSGRVVVAEVAIRGLTAGILAPVRVVPPSRHPAVERDLAVVVPESTPAGSVDDAIRRHAGPLLADLDLFDVYRGAPLGGDEKSLAFRIVFRADRTLTEDEVDAVVADVVAGLAPDVGGRVRT
ncbi:MAG TPA: phenylalanine--tRNA ligase subunit beta, partial [Candidatus Limnocylindrales bacterium]|nr:phenylalanine--tRNA ligase subunit beta [Candidatus Limnocylindrales bacterium]